MGREWDELKIYDCGCDIWVTEDVSDKDERHRESSMTALLTAVTESPGDKEGID